MGISGICNAAFTDSAEMPKTILVVESDSTTRSLVRYSLASLDYDIVEAPSRKCAFESLSGGQKPDLIIVGTVESSPDPVELLREIRRVQGLRFVPILVVASKESLDAQMAWKQAGATCWITKPIKQEELREMVELLIF
jgi:PleD family two-component response regulator